MATKVKKRKIKLASYVAGAKRPRRSMAVNDYEYERLTELSETLGVPRTKVLSALIAFYDSES